MIQAKGLSMQYGPVKALEDVSFDVNDGEIVALLGPNGAGKSTCMKILTTYLHPTKGTAEVAGFDILENPLEARANIGYLPERNVFLSCRHCMSRHCISQHSGISYVSRTL